jgi:hypothetical protein
MPDAKSAIERLEDMLPKDNKTLRGPFKTGAKQPARKRRRLQVRASRRANRG